MASVDMASVDTAGMDAPTGPSQPPSGEADGARDAKSVARAIVLRKLAASARSRAQLLDCLRKRDIPDDVSEAVLDHFAAIGYVDDAAFAEGWVHGRHRSRGLARSVIRRELRARGVDEDVAAEALAVISDDDERARAAALVRSRMRTVAGQTDEVRVRRMAQMLMRRGYPGPVAIGVVREVLAEE